jgi:hypothetical protein
VSDYTYSFEAQIVHHNVGTYVYTVVFLPDELRKKLPLKKHPRLRIDAELAEHPFEGAWQPVKGRWYVMLSKQILKDVALKVGDWAEFRFAVMDQDAVNVPGILQDALDENKKAGSAWKELTAGKQRGFAYRVVSAKTAGTREKRLAEVIEALQSTKG